MLQIKSKLSCACVGGDDEFAAHEEMIGLYAVASTHADVLVAVVEDVLLHLNLPLSKLRGQCYDGASSMAGHRSGVATQILEKEPKALYTHCYSHALNLACGDSMKTCATMNDALSTVHEISSRY